MGKHDLEHKQKNCQMRMSLINHTNSYMMTRNTTLFIFSKNRKIFMRLLHNVGKEIFHILHLLLQQ